MNPLAGLLSNGYNAPLVYSLTCARPLGYRTVDGEEHHCRLVKPFAGRADCFGASEV